VERARVNPYSHAREKSPTVEELKEILAVINTDCLRGKRDFALIYALAITCRRSAELLELKWGDIEHEPLENGDRIYNFTARKKGEEVRKRKVLDRNVYQAICAYLKADGRLDPSEGHYPDDGDYIFVAIDPTRILRIDPDVEVDPNSPISGHTANGILKKLARRAGVDERKAHIHALRHAGARLRVTKMKETGDGVDYVELMQLLEHSSLAVTQIYSEIVLEDPEDPSGRDAAEALLPTQHPRRRRKEETPAEQQKLL
jgi:integrase